MFTHNVQNNLQIVKADNGWIVVFSDVEEGDEKTWDDNEGFNLLKNLKDIKTLVFTSKIDLMKFLNEKL